MHGICPLRHATLTIALSETRLIPAIRYLLDNDKA